MNKENRVMDGCKHFFFSPHVSDRCRLMILLFLLFHLAEDGAKGRNAAVVMIVKPVLCREGGGG